VKGLELQGWSGQKEEVMPPQTRQHLHREFSAKARCRRPRLLLSVWARLPLNITWPSATTRIGCRC